MKPDMGIYELKNGSFLIIPIGVRVIISGLNEQPTGASLIDLIRDIRAWADSLENAHNEPIGEGK